MKGNLCSHVMKFRERGRFIRATMLSGWGAGGNGGSWAKGGWVLGVWGEVGGGARLCLGDGGTIGILLGGVGCAGGAGFWLQEAVEPVLACLTARAPRLSSPCLCLSVSRSVSPSCPH